MSGMLDNKGVRHSRIKALPVAAQNKCRERSHTYASEHSFFPSKLRKMCEEHPGLKTYLRGKIKAAWMDGVNYGLKLQETTT
jgi:hypothetical protein